MPTPSGVPVASAPVVSAAHFILRPTRWLIYAALTASALFFLAPLVVVLLGFRLREREYRSAITPRP